MYSLNFSRKGVKKMKLYEILVRYRAYPEVTLDDGNEQYQLYPHLNTMIARNDSDLDKEIEVGRDRDQLFIWIKGSEEAPSPDYILHNVPKKLGRPVKRAEEYISRTVEFAPDVLRFIDNQGVPRYQYIERLVREKMC
jgi:hypothetical protein